MKARLLLLAVVCCLGGCAPRATGGEYLVEGRVVKAGAHANEFLVECDSTLRDDPVATDRYVRGAAALLAQQKGYSHFTCRVEERCGTLVLRPYYLVGRVTLFQSDAAPADAVDALQYLRLNPL